jgi:hypothetical protein
MNLYRPKLIPFYLVLSAANGVVPFLIALVLSFSVIHALLVWALATAATFVLINLVCLRTAWKNTDPTSGGEQGSADLEKVPVFR